MKQQNYDTLHKVVCAKSKEIAENKDVVKEYHVGTLVNFDLSENIGWAPTFRLSNKYTYTRKTIDALAQSFCSDYWEIHVVKGAMEITVHVKYSDAEKLITKNDEI